MLKNLFTRGIAKQVWFCSITLLIFASVGVCRMYRSLLFYQLDLPDSKITLNNDEQMWIASCLGFLCPIGSLLGGTISDIFGRKSNMYILPFPYVISWLIISFSKNFLMLLVGLTIQGVGLGMAMCVITYTAELSTSKFRGLVLSLVDLTFNLGVVICNILMYYLKWTTVGLMFAAFNVLSLFLVYTLPESPAWLLSKGKSEEAIKQLCAIRNASPEKLIDEINDMQKSCIKNNNERVTLRKFVKYCVNAWKQMIISLTYVFLVNHAGHFIMLTYLVIILKALNIPFNTARVAMIYSTFGLVGSLLTPLFFHNYNRKTVLIISSLGMGFSMAVVASYEEVFLDAKDKPYAWLIPLALCTYVFFSNVGSLPLLFIIGGELFPLEGRGCLQGIWGCVGSVYWVLSIKYYPLVLFEYGIKTLMWSFTINCFVLTLFGVFVLPETKGKTLNEVQEQYFKKPKPVLNTELCK